MCRYAEGTLIKPLIRTFDGKFLKDNSLPSQVRNPFPSPQLSAAFYPRIRAASMPNLSLSRGQKLFRVPKA